MPQIEEIALNEIEIPHPRSRDSEEFNNLVRNIEKQGLLHPVKVKRESKDSYLLVFGEGRVQACKELGWMFISAMVVNDMSEEEILLEWLTENLQRVKMSSKDKALNIKRLIDDYGLSKKEAANQLGISITTVRTLYNVAVKGSTKLKDALDKGMVASAGIIAKKFDEHKKQDDVLDVFTEEKVDREVDRIALVKSLKTGDIDIKSAVSTIKKDHKHYRKMLNLAISRREKLLPHFKSLQQDEKFMQLLKEQGIKYEIKK